MEQEGRELLTNVISGQVYVCPGCNKAIKTHDEHTPIVVFSHIKCIKISGDIVLNRYTYRPEREQLSLFPSLVPPKKSYVAAPPIRRLLEPKIDKEEFAEFLKAKKDGLL